MWLANCKLFYLPATVMHIVENFEVRLNIRSLKYTFQNFEPKSLRAYLIAGKAVISKLLFKKIITVVPFDKY